MIAIDFAGWVTIEPKRAKFAALKDGIPETINGEDWIALDEETQGWYTLEDIVDAQRDAYDGIFKQVDISIEEYDD